MPRAQADQTLNWMEMIRIRMDQSMRTGAEARIMAHLDQIQRSPDAPRVVVHRHLSVSNDLMIVLQWTTLPQAAGSSLAYSLCRELEVFGLVDHTVWSGDCFAGTFRRRHPDDAPPRTSTRKA